MLRLPPIALALLTACGSGALAESVGRLELAESSLTFEDSRHGRPNERTVVIRNSGTARTRAVVRVSQPFLTDADSITLSPDSETTISVFFLPDSYDPADGTLTVRVDGRDLTASLSATVDSDWDDDGAIAEEAGGDDCDDDRPEVGPGQPEVCDGLDNDCSGVADDNAVDADTWLADLDGDGFGDPDNPTTACEVPARHTADASDCDDGDRLVNPSAAERSDGVDQDCDGRIDEHLLTAGSLVISEVHPGEGAVPPYVEVLVGDVAAPVWLAGLEVSLGDVSIVLDGDGVGHPSGDVVVLCGTGSPGAIDGHPCEDLLPDAAIADQGLRLRSEVLVDAVDAGVLSFSADGSSEELQPGLLDATDNDEAASWCSSTTPLVDGYGTPGEVATHCGDDT